MIDQGLILILFVLIIFLMILIVSGLGIFIYYQKKNNQSNQAQPSQSVQTIQPIPPANDKKIVGLCSICEKELTDETHFEIDNIHLCKEHYNTYIKNDWEEITNQRTTADTPEAGVYIYNFQKELWKNEKIPSFILCEYKIDIESDKIETYVKLNVLKNMADILRQRIEKNKVIQ